MKVFLKKYNHLTLFYFLFISALLILFFSQFRQGYAKETFSITEWLINYQGGFVRRGLMGEIILNLYNYFGLSPYNTILFLSVTAYVILLWFFIRSFIKNGYSIFILPFVFFLGGPIINDSWVKKDVLLVLIFTLIIHFSRKKSQLYLILVNLFFVIGLLVHETIGFFGLPILLFILISNNNDHLKVGRTSIKSITVSLLQLSPSIFTFLLCLYNKGTLTISNLIWNSWKAIEFPIQAEGDSKVPASSSIDGLSWSVKQGFSLVRNNFSNYNDGIYAPIAWLIILLLVYYVLTNTDRLNEKILNYNPTQNFNKITVSNILIFQFLSIIPLFIIGWDYGRWVFFWVSTSFSIILLIPDEKLSTLFPEHLTSVSIRINTALDAFFGKSMEITLYIVLILGLPLCGWSMSFYFNTTAVSVVLQFISDLIFQLILLIKWGMKSII